MTRPADVFLDVLAALDDRALDALRARLDAETEREEIARDEGTELARVQARGDA